MEIFSLMLWPLLACLLLPWLLVYYGLHIVRREIIFVDLALAQVAALGSCLALLLGYDPHLWQSLAWSFAFTVVGAVIFTLTRTRDHRLPQEALIGVVYVVAAAAAVLMLSRSASGDEELRRTLVGEILVVQPYEIWRTLALYLGIGIIHWVFRRQFIILSFHPEQARAEGISLRKWDFLFYVLFGFVVTSFVHIGGVLLVFSYLIVPALAASLFAKNLLGRMITAWALATLAGIAGLYASFRFDFPTGAAIVCALGAMLLLTMAAAKLLRRTS